jgi:hypothetical protein
MAVIYLRSTDGSDSDNGSTWSLAKATLAAAESAAGSGGIVYMSQAHAETSSGNITLIGPSTAGASPCRIICVNDGAMPPTTRATGGSVSATGGAAMNMYGDCHYIGVTFNIGSGSAVTSGITVGVSSDYNFIFDNCAFSILTTHINGRIFFGSSGANNKFIKLINTTITFSAIAQSITTEGGVFIWANTQSAVSGAIPTTLISIVRSGSVVLLSGLDLSSLDSGKNIVNLSSASITSQMNIINCKLGTSVSILSSTVGSCSTYLHMDNSDSADTNYRMEHYGYYGSIKAETVKVRSGGASDGTTALSWNMTSLSSASFVTPLASPQFSIWNDTTGSSKTVTVEILHDSVTALTDADIWLEVEEMGTSGYPISTIQSDRAANILATPANQDASSATWTTTGLTNPNKQYLQVTFTPAKKGFFQARVMLAEASKTVYIDPLMTVA